MELFNGVQSNYSIEACVKNPEWYDRNTPRQLFAKGAFASLVTSSVVAFTGTPISRAKAMIMAVASLVVLVTLWLRHNAMYRQLNRDAANFETWSQQYTPQSRRSLTPNRHDLLVKSFWNTLGKKEYSELETDHIGAFQSWLMLQEHQTKQHDNLVQFFREDVPRNYLTRKDRIAVELPILVRQLISFYDETINYRNLTDNNTPAAIRDYIWQTDIDLPAAIDAELKKRGRNEPDAGIKTLANLLQNQQVDQQFFQTDVRKDFYKKWANHRLIRPVLIDFFQRTIKDDGLTLSKSLSTQYPLEYSMFTEEEWGECIKVLIDRDLEAMFLVDSLEDLLKRNNKEDLKKYTDLKYIQSIKRIVLANKQHNQPTIKAELAFFKEWLRISDQEALALA